MYLEVSKTETRVSDSTNQEYVRAEFRPVKFLDNGKTIFTSATSGTRIFNPGKAPQAGDVFEGKVVAFDTTDYDITDVVTKSTNTVNKLTVVAFSDENPQDLALKQAARNGATLVINGKAIDNPYGEKEPEPEPKKAGNGKKA